MGRIRTIARRTFLIGSAAIAGGVAFGAYVVARPHENPLADDLPDGAAGSLRNVIRLSLGDPVFHLSLGQTGLGVLGRVGFGGRHGLKLPARSNSRAFGAVRASGATVPRWRIGPIR